jgi:hypothetical protein
MIIPSTEKYEINEVYHRIYSRKNLPALLQDYDFISIAGIMERRILHYHQADRNFDPCSDTDSGDGIVYGMEGDALIVLDAPLLRQISEKTPLLNGAVRLNYGQWEELRAAENTLYLTGKQAEEADLEGFVYKNGAWQPKNEIVEMIWEHLSRGIDLRDYVQYVYEETRQVLGWDYQEIGYLVHIMSLHFDCPEESYPTLRPWKLEYITSNASAFTPINLTHPLLVRKMDETAKSKKVEEDKKAVKVVENYNGGIEYVI